MTRLNRVASFLRAFHLVMTVSLIVSTLVGTTIRFQFVSFYFYGFRCWLRFYFILYISLSPWFLFHFFLGFFLVEASFYFISWTFVSFPTFQSSHYFFLFWCSFSFSSRNTYATIHWILIRSFIKRVVSVWCICTCAQSHIICLFWGRNCKRGKNMQTLM